MTSLWEHDRSLRTESSPEEKLLQALELMATGLAMKRSNLARRQPEATAEQLEALYQQWLFADV